MGHLSPLSMASPSGLPCSTLGWLANFAGEHTFRSSWGKLKRAAVFMLLGQAAQHHTASCLKQQERTFPQCRGPEALDFRIKGRTGLCSLAESKGELFLALTLTLSLLDFCQNHSLPRARTSRCLYAHTHTHMACASSNLLLSSIKTPVVGWGVTLIQCALLFN